MQMFGLKADRQQSGAANDAKSSYQGTPQTGASQSGASAYSGSQSEPPPPQYGSADWSNKEAVTIISEDIVINGNISAKRPICLEGTVEGDLRGDQVIVGKAGAVTGSIVANEVEVHGRVLGSIHSKSVMLYKTAHVEGDILHQGIGIEMGTHYDGRLKWEVTEQQAGRGHFDPAHAAPKPISANDPGHGYDQRAEHRSEQRPEMTVAYNAEATSPQY